MQCVLPAGIEFYRSGLDANDPSSYPRSYPVVLTGKVVNLGIFSIAFDDYSPLS